MKSILINMARLNLCRTLWHRLHSKYSDKECYDAFVDAMNTLAKEWGMTQTLWINPSGVGNNGVYSQSTANDLSIMALRAYRYRMDKFHGRDGYELHIRKPYVIWKRRDKVKKIYSTTSIDSIGDNFPIVMAKTGSGDGYQTLVMVCKIGESVVSGAVMNAKDEQGRFDAMDELMHLGERILHGDKKAANYTISNAKEACLYTINEIGEPICIFAQHADEPSAPMSTTKVMTYFLASKYLKDDNRMEYILPVDTDGMGNDILHDWDKLSLNDLINAMMRCSSNVAANALARIAGGQIIKHKNQI